jgi:hypothetical protein
MLRIGGFRAFMPGRVTFAGNSNHKSSPANTTQQSYYSYKYGKPAETSFYGLHYAHSFGFLCRKKDDEWYRRTYQG